MKFEADFNEFREIIVRFYDYLGDIWEKCKRDVREIWTKFEADFCGFLSELSGRFE